LEIYKIGMMKNDIDKNGGMFEYNLIRKELSGCTDDKLILVGGNPYIGENEVITRILEKYKNKKKIFIATDSIVFAKCMQIMNACDIVLHQTPKSISKIHPLQKYSYVPELFYKEFDSQPIVSGILFGGNDTGRQDLFRKYILGHDGDLREYIMAFVKTVNEEGKISDSRIDYNDFMGFMKSYKYSLVISRKEYRELGWVTPRFMEAIGRNNVPLVDVNYDRYGHLKYISKVNSYIELIDLMKRFDNNPGLKNGYLEEQRKTFRQAKGKFKEIIMNI